MPESVQGNKPFLIEHSERFSRESALLDSALQDLKSAMELFVLINEGVLWRSGNMSVQKISHLLLFSVYNTLWSDMKFTRQIPLLFLCALLCFGSVFAEKRGKRTRKPAATLPAIKTPMPAVDA